MTRDREAFGRLLRDVFAEDSRGLETDDAVESSPLNTGQVLVERADWLSHPEITIGFDGKNRYFSLGLSSTSTLMWDEGLVVHLQDQADGIPAWITDLAVLSTASPYALDLARSIVGQQAWEASEGLLQESREEVVVTPAPEEVQELRLVWRKAARLLQLETQHLPEAVLDDASLALITAQWTELHTLSSTDELVAARAEIASKGGGTYFEWEVDDEAIARDLVGASYSPKSLWPLLSILVDNDLAVVTLSRLKAPVDKSLRVYVRLGAEQSVWLRPQVQDGEHVLRASVTLNKALDLSGRPPITTSRYP